MRTSTIRPAGPVVTGAAVVAALTLSACTTARADRTTPDPAPVTATASAPEAPPVTAQELALLAAAEDALVRECAADHGVHLPQPAAASGPERAADPADVRAFPFVVDSPGWAAEHGYGSDLDAEREGARTSDPTRTYLQSLPAGRRTAALDVLNGGPDDPALRAKLPVGTSIGRSATSCTSRAQDALYGDAAQWFQASAATGNLEPLWTGRVLADQRYADAVGPWSDCMSRRGHDVATPRDARQAAYGTPDESATASDEAACATTTGLAAVVADLTTEHESRVCQEFRADVESRRALEHAALGRAREITAELTPEQIAAGARTRGAPPCEES
ncbi:hypothetical protein [Promicromonospora sp. NPDC057488]|uniref:hypothetical protein n=1 Tax=Promicromonospora sp. NPDC057488 TaxID=3346147 RepID=UPI00366EE6B0